MAIVSQQLVDDDVLVESPDGSSVTHVYKVTDDAGAALTRLDVWTWASTNYPLGLSLTDFDNLKVYERQISRLNNDTHGFVWIVRITYKTQTYGPVDEVPWNDNPSWEWISNAYDVPMDVDFSSTPKTVANTAGDPFENPPTYLRVDGELRYTRNINPNSLIYELVREQMTDGANRRVYGNSDTYTIMRIGGANGQIIQPRRSVMWIDGVGKDVRNNVEFPVVRFAFRFYPEEYGDEVELYSFGYNQIVGGKKKNIVINGDVPRLPMPLDAAGAVIDLVASPTATPFLHTFKRPVTLVPFSPYSWI